MDQHGRLLTLITNIYAAPGTTDGWMPFLQNLGAHANAAHIMSISPRAHHAEISMTTVESPEETLRVYNEHWGAFDPWRSPRLHALRHPAVILGEELIAHTALKESGYYFEFARRYDLVRCMIGMIENGADGVSVISINRGERQAPFDNEDAALLRALVPHLRRGLQLHRRLLSSEARTHDLAELVDSMTHALVLVDGAGRVRFMNRAASRLVESRDGITVDAGELRAARATETARLRSLIADATATSAGSGIGAGGTLTIGRPSGRRPLLALVAPVRADRAVVVPDCAPAAAMVVITDPESTRVAGEDVLRTLFRLTASEAALARLLAEGATLNDAASLLKVSTETVRKRIKTVFDKTGTHRQSELVALIINSSAGLPR